MLANKKTKNNHSQQKTTAESSQKHEPAASVDWRGHLEALPLATWIGNPDGSSVFVNLAYRRLLGVVDIKTVADRRWEGHLHPDDREHYVQAWDLFVEGQDARFKQTVRWIRPDTGQTVKFAVRAQKLCCGQYQGWIRTNTAEQALATLEGLTYVHTRGA